MYNTVFMNTPSFTCCQYFFNVSFALLELNKRPTLFEGTLIKLLSLIVLMGGFPMGNSHLEQSYCEVTFQALHTCRILRDKGRCSRNNLPF